MDIDVQVNVPETIVKRDGDADRIETALKRCFNSLSRRPVISTGELTQQVVNIVAAKYEQPTVEQIQDIVEMVLLAACEYEAAKHYNWALRRQRPHHGGAGSGLLGGYV